MYYIHTSSFRPLESQSQAVIRLHLYSAKYQASSPMVKYIQGVLTSTRLSMSPCCSCTKRAEMAAMYDCWLENATRPAPCDETSILYSAHPSKHTRSYSYLCHRKIRALEYKNLQRQAVIPRISFQACHFSESHEQTRFQKRFSILYNYANIVIKQMRSN